MGIMAWVSALTLVTVVSVLWFSFSPMIYDTLLPMAAEMNDTGVDSALMMFPAMWANWPLVFMIGAIMLVILAGSRRQAETW